MTEATSTTTDPSAPAPTLASRLTAFMATVRAKAAMFSPFTAFEEAEKDIAELRSIVVANASSGTNAISQPVSDFLAKVQSDVADLKALNVQALVADVQADVDAFTPIVTALCAVAWPAGTAIPAEIQAAVDRIAAKAKALKTPPVQPSSNSSATA